MATCIDHSRNFSTDSNSCQINSSICRLISLCRTSASSSLDSGSLIHRYEGNPMDKESWRIRPQQPADCQEDQIWQKIREEAALDCQQERALSEYYFATIFAHNSLESALANQLAIRLSNPNLSSDNLYKLFSEALMEDAEMKSAIREDLRAVRERDPACRSYVHCFLNYKGFLACQAHRIAHELWSQGRTVLALLIQGRVSEVFALDIHPGAKIGAGIVLDHGTGVVIGETAVIGNNVTMLHDVTLGGTGKVVGDRHPKIGDQVFIGAGAKVLGNIRIGEGAKIGAGSVVLKEVPPNATAVGNPARLVGVNNRPAM